MSKYGKTKSDVLKLISENKDTLSIISSELGLAPSTVSKHLNELQDLGAIRLVKSEYAKKWKPTNLFIGGCHKCSIICVRMQMLALDKNKLCCLDG